MPEALQTNFHLVRRAGAIMDKDFATVSDSETVGQLEHRMNSNIPAALLIRDDNNKIQGVIVRDKCICDIGPTEKLAKLARSDYVTISPDAALIRPISARYPAWLSLRVSERILVSRLES
jgi:Mg/Co/Ni transporter MgtE